MRKISKIAMITGLAAVMICFAGMQGRGQDMQKSIAQKIIRFHVIANSDSDEDQALKLKVKERVVASMKPVLAQADGVDEARRVMREHLGEIEQTASETLQEEGCSYSVHAELTTSHFPVKSYGEFTFPDGDYEALRIIIGEGEGKNWWCVMYPNMCFSGSVYEVIDEEAEESLKQVLTTEEYEAIMDSGNYEVRLKWLSFLE